MSDLTFALRLTADGSAYVGELRIAKDATQDLTGSTKALATQSDASSAASKRDAAAVRDNARARKESSQAARDEAAAKVAAERASIAAEKAAAKAAREANAAAQATQRANRTSSIQLGQQLQDAAIMAQGGMSWLTILTTQGSQAAYVLSSMEGGTNKFKNAIASAATFIAGPWGAALAVGTIAATALVAALSEGEEKTRQIEVAGDALGAAQSKLGEYFDLTTGKIKGQTEALRLHLEILKLNLMAEAEKAGGEAKALRDKAGQLGWGEAIFRSDNPADWFGKVRNTKATAILDDFKAGRIDSKTAVQRAKGLDYSGSNIDYRGMIEALGKLEEQLRKTQLAGAVDRTAERGEVDPSLRTPAKARPRASSERARTEQQVLADFARELEARGVDVISTFRTAAKQNALHQQGLTPADGYTRRSPHQAWRAVDLNKATFDEQKVQEAAQAAGLKGMRILTESGGRKHVEWQGAGKRGEVDVDGPARAAAAAEAAARRLEDFGDRAGERIQRLNEQFDRTPRAVDSANAAIREANALIAELAERKPPGFEAMIADARKLEPLIRQSLRQPILDMLGDQERQIEAGKAILANDQGRVAELDALNQLMDAFGVESEAQLAVQLAQRDISGDQVRLYFDQLDVLRQQSREIDKQQISQQRQLGLVNDIRTSMRDGIADLLDGQGLGAAGNMMKRIFSAYKANLADEIADSLFGDVFRKQEDRIKGIDEVSTAGTKLAGEMDKVSAALPRLTSSIVKAANGIDPDGEKKPDGAVPEDGIVVTATPDAEYTLKSVLKDLLGKIFGKDLAKEISAKFAAVMEGMVLGQAGSGVLQSLGIKQSSTGAAIGGAIGNAVGSAIGSIGGPLGSVIGGMLGGTIGGLFRKTKTGSAQVVYADGGAAVGSTAGNSAAFKRQATGLAGNVVSGLEGLAEQLGGVITDKLSVSIGVRKGKPVVDTTGQNRTKGAGTIKFDKDDVQGAVAAALADAISDGAIGGISAKVQAALKSSDDIDKALREALKVDSIEQILEGLGGANRKVFVDFERQAKERLRIASKYGFDVVKLEAENAKERKKLLESAIEQATGGLKQLLEEMATGEMAAGSPADRRAALLAKIETVKVEAVSDPDAAAKLSDLLDQLYAVSLEANGSAGEAFAADRALIKSTADTIIAAATAEITAAQDKARQNAGTDQASTDALLSTANGALFDIAGSMDDLYNINAQMLAQLVALRGLSSASSSAGSASDLVGAAISIGRSVM